MHGSTGALIQGKSLSKVDLIAVTGSLPMAGIKRNTPMSVPVTRPTTVRFKVVTYPTFTHILWGSTWRFTARPPPHLHQEPLATHQWVFQWVVLCPLRLTQPEDDKALCSSTWPTSMWGTFSRPLGSNHLHTPHSNGSKTSEFEEREEKQKLWCSGLFSSQRQVPWNNNSYSGYIYKYLGHRAKLISC